MKKIVLDSGPIINLAMNNLLWTFEKLKEISEVRFLITGLVKKETVDYPLEKTKKYRFEALQVLHYIENGTLEVIDNPEIKQHTESLMELANSTYRTYGHNMNLLHAAEMSAIALYLQEGADAFAVDEKTTRLLIENPSRLHKRLKRNFHTNVDENRSNINSFRKITKSVKMIRSVELATIAYEKGLLNRYLAHIPHPRETLLEGLLWGVKLSGCAVTNQEIKRILSIEKKL
ncbi:hypothetical protein ISS07_05950 [Candidatus Woesearchaeota archaeon]|nr:hypothetical protein [Candidatus Woesearchaeota archaeon]